MKYLICIIILITSYYLLDAQSIEFISSNSESNLKARNFTLFSNLSISESDFSYEKNLFFMDFSDLNPPIPQKEMILPEAVYFRPLNYDTKIWGEYLYCDIRQLSIDVRKRDAFREND